MSVPEFKNELPTHILSTLTNTPSIELISRRIPVVQTRSQMQIRTMQNMLLT